MTLIAVDPAPGRARVTHTPGPVAARVQRVAADGARVALVATTALLLGGDHVEFDVRVGPGGWLDVVETAGTVAYDAQGVRSGWTVRARLGPGARLTWNGEPFVIADGADVHRVTELDLAPGATACLRETLVFGRAGESGGALRSSTRVRLGETDLLVEELDLPDPGVRSGPGMLGPGRIIDSVLLLGAAAPPEPALPAGVRYDLAGPGTIARVLAGDTGRSGLDAVWQAWRRSPFGQ
ncbi:urease accessory protein UreD [Nakamurella sp.]|uniref:urease accessory protein UreD n=1 Tax=Nakamurella sp. TaxID=1869182 RepID=UPI0037850DF6